MKILIFKLITYAVIIFTFWWLWADNIEQRRDNKMLRDCNFEIEKRNGTLNARIDSLIDENGSKELVFHAKDFRTKDFVLFTKIGRGFRGYQLTTDLFDVDRSAIDFIIWTCIDSGIDIPFTIETLWQESRLGTNIGHKLNKDGSIDGGYFGINYKKGVAPLNRTAYTDVFEYIKKYRKLEKFPRKEWRDRYNKKYLWERDNRK